MIWKYEAPVLCILGVLMPLLTHCPFRVCSFKVFSKYIYVEINIYKTYTVHMYVYNNIYIYEFICEYISFPKMLFLLYFHLTMKILRQMKVK